MSASLILNPNSRQVGSMLGYKPVPQETNPNAVLPVELSFTRNSVGMEKRSDGLWYQVPVNMPRRYWDGTKYSWLFEPQATNGIQASYQPASWSGFAATGTNGTNTAPDGTNNGSTIALLTGGYLRATPFVSISDNVTYTASTFVKNNGLNAGETYRFYINNNQVGGLVVFATIDIVNQTAVSGVAGGASNVSARIENEANGWSRVSLTFTVNSGQTSAVTEVGFDNLSIASGSLYMWGTQFETGSVATSPIITAGSAVTRLADVSNTTGLSSVIGQTEGTLFLDSYFDAIDLFNFFLTNGGTANCIGIETNSGGGITAFIANGGATQVNMAGSAITIGGRYKVAICYALNNTRFYINGVLVSTDTTCTIPTCNQILFSRANGTGIANQRVNNAILYKTAISDAEAVLLTTI